MRDRPLHAYLQAHWSGATAGVAAFTQAAASLAGRDDVAARDLRALTDEIVADRESLRRLMSMVGLSPALVSTVSGRVSATVHRLTPRVPAARGRGVTDVLKLEGLRAAVAGKRAGWDLLRSVAEYDARLDAALLDELAGRADEQLELLQQVHLRVGVAAMSGVSAE